MLMTPIRLALAAAVFAAGSSVTAAPVAYNGEIFFCSSTCDSFGALGGETGGSSNTTNSIVTGFFDLPAGPDGSFTIATTDNVPFAITIFSSTIPLEDPVLNGPDVDCPPPNAPNQLCNATTVNPLPIVPAVATLEGSGMLDENGVPISGTLILTFTAPPFSNNGAVVELDLSDGSAFGTVFGGALTFTRIQGELTNADPDGDGFANSEDNCTQEANADQRDTDGDGFGNVCDTDLNNDCVTNVLDLGTLRTVFFTDDADADFDGDGVVNVLDLGVMRARFFEAPGPSGIENICAAQ